MQPEDGVIADAYSLVSGFWVMILDAELSGLSNQ